MNHFDVVSLKLNKKAKLGVFCSIYLILFSMFYLLVPLIVLFSCYVR